jgi:hypothetical protein
MRRHLHQRLERTDPRDERSKAVEPFDRTQGRLLERLERAFCLLSASVSTRKTAPKLLNRAYSALFFS